MRTYLTTVCTALALSAGCAQPPIVHVAGAGTAGVAYFYVVRSTGSEAIVSCRAGHDGETVCRSHPLAEALRADTSGTRTTADGATEARARLREIAAHPRAPDLGASAADVRVLCEQQSGEAQVSNGGSVDCTVAGMPLFATSAGEHGADDVDVWYVGADLTTMRDDLARTHGHWTEETVNAAGFHVFTWRTAGLTFQVSETETGVTTRAIRVAP